MGQRKIDTCLWQIKPKKPQIKKFNVVDGKIEK